MTELWLTLGGVAAAVVAAVGASLLGARNPLVPTPKLGRPASESRERQGASTQTPVLSDLDDDPRRVPPDFKFPERAWEDTGEVWEVVPPISSLEELPPRMTQKWVALMADQSWADLFSRLAESAAELNERESALLQRLALGRSAHEIADELRLSLTSAQSHIDNIYAKLGVRLRIASSGGLAEDFAVIRDEAGRVRALVHKGPEERVVGYPTKEKE